MLNNPDAPGKGWAYSRQIDTLNQDSVRTDRWRLIRVGSSYDLYDFQASPYEVDDVSAANPAVVNDLVTTKLNVQSARSGTTNYSAWRTASFSAAELTNSAISGLQADPDGDGVANIFECLSGTNPKNAGDSIRLIGTVQNLSAYGLSNDFFTARFRASALVDDIAFSVEGSAGLANWSAQPVTLVTNTPLGGGLYEYLFRNTAALAAQSQSFMRLTGEQTP
jgi:hypothetical protein